MRITLLWSRLTDYTATFFRSLAATGECELQLVFYATGGDLSFEEFDVGFARDAIRLQQPPGDGLIDRVRAFAPDVVFMSGWNLPGYLPMARALRREGARVVCSLDNPWRADLRQRLGCLAAPFMLRPAIDAFFVAGERQAQFARHLGYDEIFHGLWCANVARFDGAAPFAQRPPKLLYVGRLIERKGIRPLLAAYRRYRAMVEEPMPLVMAGKGVLGEQCRAEPGVDLRGFVQPAALPALFSEAQAFILPSYVEHWGVVLHEAAASGLALIASDACGATTRFLQDGANGFLVQATEGSLLEALLEFHRCDLTRRQQMSAISTSLGRSWTPPLQAAYFLRKVRRLLDARAPR